MVKIFVTVFVFLSLAVPAYGQASLPTADPIGAGAPGGSATSGQSASQSCDQAQCQDGEGLCIPNPLTECNIQDLLGKIIDWLIAFSIIISVGMIVWAGMMYVTAAGNTDKVKEAQRLIIYALIGLVIILSAKGISLVIQSFFK